MLCSELHETALGGRAPPGPAGEAIALPQAPSRYKGEGGKGTGEERGNEEWEGEGRDGKRRDGSTWIFVQGAQSY